MPRQFVSEHAAPVGPSDVSCIPAFLITTLGLAWLEHFQLEDKQ